MCHAVSFRISSSIESAVPGINYLTLSIVSLNQIYSGIANELTMLIMFTLVMRFYGTCTSFEVLELFKVSIQSLLPISEVIFVLLNDKYREVQTIVFYIKIRAIHSNRCVRCS
ncbi:hypothetical protein L2E82_06133 [Cichorium intybus]|uniref:Uncharacterized protein n=1 Tax=Cichorium intybus TaxID=13427 RepID=A0ACB9HAB1_CICIN|nr:hypothetical protein L2E82_06133 [Cichorium intybus]